jgi:SNF2 family DNA or RNA helicase
MIKPYFLRRLKDEVEDSIPPLKETVIEVGLT